MTDKNSLYYINEPTCISFSGGRTSAYMLHKVLEAHDGDLPEFAKITFANTGKEMPQTLDFVRDVGVNWGVDIVWLERFARKATEEEKIGRVKTPYTSFIGIRGDEVRRAVKLNGTIESGQERYLPLYLEGVTAKDVGKFWDQNDFDLALPNNNGVTDWGNCDLCFLKGHKKKQSIIRSRPDLADWWIEQEESLSKEVGLAAYFRSDQPSYRIMQTIAIEQTSIFDDIFDDETIPCFCGD